MRSVPIPDPVPPPREWVSWNPYKWKNREQIELEIAQEAFISLQPLGIINQIGLEIWETSDVYFDSSDEDKMPTGWWIKLTIFRGLRKTGPTRGPTRRCESTIFIFLIKTFILKTYYTVLALGSLHWSHLGVIIILETIITEVLSAVNILVVVCIYFDILKWRNFRLEQSSDSSNTRSSQFLAWVDQQTCNDAFSLIGDSLKRVSPCQNEARSKFSEIVHPPWHPAPVTFGVKEKVSPAPGSKYTNPNKVLKCCKLLISHRYITNALHDLPGDSRMIQPPSWQHPTQSQQARLLKQTKILSIFTLGLRVTRLGWVKLHCLDKLVSINSMNWNFKVYC